MEGSYFKEGIRTHNMNGTWTIAPNPTCRKMLGNLWVVRTKCFPVSNVECLKARQGYERFTQQPEIDFFVTYDSVCKNESGSYWRVLPRRVFQTDQNTLTVRRNLSVGLGHPPPLIFGVKGFQNILKGFPIFPQNTRTIISTYVDNCIVVIHTIVTTAQNYNNIIYFLFNASFRRQLYLSY